MVNPFTSDDIHDLQPLPFVPEMQWLEPGVNPFGIRCLDIRTFTRDMLSTPARPDQVETFLELRQSTGSHVYSRFPDQCITMPCKLAYPFTGKAREGALFRAAQMEEKWDIFLLSDALYFSRSWNGDLIYKAETYFYFDKVEITTIQSTASALEFGPQQVICDVDYLVKSLLFKKDAPHCIPLSLPDDELGIAVYSFASFGKWASYATFENTSQIPVDSCPDRTL